MVTALLSHCDHWGISAYRFVVCQKELFIFFGRRRALAEGRPLFLHLPPRNETLWNVTWACRITQA
jgi:hypothetical protein